MLQALQTATAPETLSVCPVVRGLVIDSLMPTLGRIDEIERRGGLRPGVGDAVLPPGLSVPGGNEVSSQDMGLSSRQSLESDGCTYR